MAGFVHLRVHSAYSLSEGAIKADKLPALARDAGMPAVAITDSNNLFGALEFSQACVAKGVQPIVGCQIALSSDGQSAVGSGPAGAAGAGRGGAEQSAAAEFIRVLETDPSLPAQVSFETLAAHAAGLMVLTGGSPGPVARLMSEGQKAEAERLLHALCEAFPERVAMELHRHGLEAQRHGRTRADCAGGCDARSAGRHQ